MTIVLPEVSIIIPSALLFVPATTPGASDNGTFKIILKVSSSSTMSSSVTATLTVVLAAPAGIVALRAGVLKSTLSVCRQQLHNYNFCTQRTVLLQDHYFIAS